MDQNLYWHTTKSTELVWNYLTFEKWQEFGNDKRGIVADPLFVDPENRSFNFKSDKAYKKIGFVPFSLTFGVIGDEWRHIAEDYKFEDSYPVPDPVQYYGEYSFEDSESEYVLSKFMELSDKEKVFITNEKCACGTKSLTFASTNGKYIDSNRPTASFLLSWTKGVNAFSAKIFLEKDAHMMFNIGLTRYDIEFKNGKIISNKNEYMEYPTSEWFEFKIKSGYGKNKTENFTMSVNDNEMSIKISWPNFKSSSTASFSIANSTAYSYIDCIKAEINPMPETYFANEVKWFYSSLATSETSKNKSGMIAGIVIAVIAVVAIAIVAIFYYFKKKNDNSEESDLIVNQLAV